MAISFFGYQFPTPAKKEEEQRLQTFVKKDDLDGAMEVQGGVPGFFGYGVAVDNTPLTDEVALITKYRDMEHQPEIERAVDDIVNETFSYDGDEMPVKLNLDQLNVPPNIKQTFRQEFETILNLLNFRSDLYDIFKRWYIDGRLYYHKVIISDPLSGIRELRYIDPRKIKKVREDVTDLRKGAGQPNYSGYANGNANGSSNGASKPNGNANVVNQRSAFGTSFDKELNREFIEYYVYNPKGIQPMNPHGLKITSDSITYVNSGILDKTNTVVLSNLHKCLKIMNELRMVETSLIIYRLARAPERRVFNIEVGNLPPAKAEQALKNAIARNRRKMIYDANTGEVKDDRKFMTILEDFWFAKRDGKGTEVTTLPGGQNLSQIEDVEYFQQKLYQSLDVPISRLQQGQPFTLGRSSEITQDELKFTKFVSRLRKRFSALFDDILGTQLTLKNIIKMEDWDEIKKNISYDFLEDNFFSELKMSDIWNNRFANLQLTDPYVGRYVSREWVAKKILNLNEDEWQEMQMQMMQEIQMGLVPDPMMNPMINPAAGMMMQQGQPGQQQDPMAYQQQDQIPQNQPGTLTGEVEKDKDRLIN